MQDIPVRLPGPWEQSAGNRGDICGAPAPSCGRRRPSHSRSAQIRLSHRTRRRRPIRTQPRRKLRLTPFRMRMLLPSPRRPPKARSSSPASAEAFSPRRTSSATATRSSIRSSRPTSASFRTSRFRTLRHESQVSRSLANAARPIGSSCAASTVPITRRLTIAARSSPPRLARSRFRTSRQAPSRRSRHSRPPPRT